MPWKHLGDVMGFSYKRLRKWLTPLRDEKRYGKLREELMVLLRREVAGEIEVFFGDEGGFFHRPSVPYGWGEKGKTGCIQARKSGRCNVFGLLSTDNTFGCRTIAGKLDASFVVASLYEFAEKLNNQKTVVVLDKASVRANAFNIFLSHNKSPKNELVVVRYATNFFNYFSNLKGPRVDRNKLHSLNDILFLTVCAVMSGCYDWDEIEEYGKEKESWLKKHIGLPNGILSHDTINRLFARLDPKKLQEGFIGWVGPLVGKGAESSGQH